MEENRLDSLIYILNKIGSDSVMRRTENDVVFSYEFVSFIETNVLEIYFKRKTDKTKTNIIRLTSDGNDDIINEAANILLRYVIFAKDYTDGKDLRGTPINIYSAKTIFGNGLTKKT